MTRPTTTTIPATCLAIFLAFQIVLGESPNTCSDVQIWNCDTYGGNSVIALKNDGTSVVLGIGEMRDYEPFLPPWYSIKNSFTSIIIEKGVTYIKADWILNGTALTSINVHGDNSRYRSVDGVLFSKIYPSRLILYPGGKQGPYTIPNGVITIEKYAFNGCTGLTSITIPDAGRSIIMEEGVFRACTNLTSVTIEGCARFSGLRSIGKGAFSYCTNLTSITIPGGVELIEKYAFDDCTRLMSVTILGRGRRMMYIEERAFRGCTSLTSITCLSPVPPHIQSEAFDGLPSSACLYVPEGSIDAYREAYGWKTFECFKGLTPKEINAIAPDKISEDTKGVPWLALSILTSLILSVAIFVIIKKLRRRPRQLPRED